MATPIDIMQQEMPQELLTEEEMNALNPQYSPEVTPESLGQEPLFSLPEEDEEAEEIPIDPKHYENLAAKMKPDQLDKIAQELIELVEQDDNSRQDWEKRVISGIRNLGVSDKTSGGADFEGASKVVHPLLMDSVTQFQSRAIQEMWPSKGPVKTQILGPTTPERLAQSQRVQDYMNYLYMVEMPEAFNNEDNMLLRLPISGSCFKKMFYDPMRKRLTSIFVEPSDFIIAYQTTELATSPRFTHRVREYINDVRKKESTGHYIKNPNQDDVHNEDTDKPMLIDEIDDTQGTHRVSYIKEDDRATMYEVYVDYKLDGLGTNGPNPSRTGSTPESNKDEILKPYIITIDRDEQTVKRIQRNWKPDDQEFTKRMYFTHFKFTPGLGFYGYGFLHLIGDLALSATGTLRSLLDSAGFANMQGGFRSRDSRLPGGDKPIAPGEWREVNSTAEELSKGFFPLPYKEPSATLFNLLGYLDDKASQLVGTTDTVTGESNPKDAPVGTTAMLLEQGMKVFTSIHKRLHESHKLEFKIMAELVEEYMPDEGYPFLFGQEEATLMPEDFDERIDVIPISDPNLASTAQRIAKSQTILELQQTYPETIGEREAVIRMLEALNVENIEGLVGTQEDMDAQAEKAAEAEELEKQRIELEIAKLQAEVKNLQSEAVQRNVDSTAKAMESAALVIAGTPTPIGEQLPGETPPPPAPVQNADGTTTPGVQTEPTPAPELAPLIPGKQLSAVADSILDSAGFLDLSDQTPDPEVIAAEAFAAGQQDGAQVQMEQDQAQAMDPNVDTMNAPPQMQEVGVSVAPGDIQPDVGTGVGV